MKTWYSYVLVLLWAGSLLLGLWLYSDNQLSHFDPQLNLNTAAASPEFDRRAVDALVRSGINLPAIVHVSAGADCFCETLSASHRAQLDDALPTFALHTIMADKLPETLGSALQMAPAVLVVDAQGQLRYLGPYALGYGCVTGQTLINSIVAKAQGAYQRAGAVVSQARGCFCSV